MKVAATAPTESTLAKSEGQYELIVVVRSIEDLRTRRQKARITFDVIESPVEARQPFAIVFYPDNGQTRSGHFPVLSRLTLRDKCRLSYREHKLVRVEILESRSTLREIMKNHPTTGPNATPIGPRERDPTGAVHP